MGGGSCLGRLFLIISHYVSPYRSSGLRVVIIDLTIILLKHGHPITISNYYTGGVSLLITQQKLKTLLAMITGIVKISDNLRPFAGPEPIANR